MYYENYEDYMRNSNSALPNMSNIPNPYYNYTYQNQFNYMNPAAGRNTSQLYPDLYSEINKKIENKCIAQDCRLTEENVNRITDEIYEDYKDMVIENQKSTAKSCSNSLVKDFIKILVIKYLLSRQRNNNNYFPMTPPQMPNNYYPYQC